jgi:hypothetical protein
MGCQDETLLHLAESIDGVATIEDVAWVCDERFKPGNYIITCLDVTKGLSLQQKMPSV